MSNEHTTWIDAMNADPDDRDLRLVYADWLESQGDETAAGWRWMVEQGKRPCYAGRFGYAGQEDAVDQRVLLSTTLKTKLASAVAHSDVWCWWKDNTLPIVYADWIPSCIFREMTTGKWPSLGCVCYPTCYVAESALALALVRYERSNN